VDVKDPTVSFVKSKRVFAGSMAKFQIPAQTGKGALHQQLSHASSNDANQQPQAAHKIVILS